MKILLATGIYPPESGGPATYVAGLSSALRSQGHDVSVLTYGDPSHTEKNVRRISRRGGAFIRYVRYAWAAFRMARHAEAVYVQGPVSEGLPATIGTWLAGRRVTMKVVGDYAWEMAMQRGEKDLLDPFLAKAHRGVIRLYEKVERWTARRAERVIVPSRYLATVVERWGVPRERIHVVLNANEPLPVTNGRDAERTAFGVLDRVVILTAVRAVPWKGVTELIDSVVRLPATHTLVVAGDGPELGRWKKHAEEHGVSDRVRFVGRVDRHTLARWYAASDVFVLNSGYEGYPHVVAEAASLGVPCLVSDQGGNPETQETFPSLVRILPYRDVDAWTVALSSTKKREPTPANISPWTHQQMVESTLEALRGEHDPLSVVMVSYDRELLDGSSATFARVASLSSAEVRVNALVISGARRTQANTEEGTFAAHGFRGPAFVRVFLALLRGIKLLRSASARAVVTAQDPFAAGVTGYLVSRISNVPLEIQEHGDFYSGAWQRESWRNRLLAPVGRFVLRRAEHVRVVSERVKGHVVRLGVDASRVSVVPVAQNVTALLNRPLHAMSEVPRLVAPCRFVEQKGLDVLLDAASRLVEENVLFHLTLIGEGPLERTLRRQITKLELDRHVTIEPWRDMSSLWESADLLILASRYEGWGRTVVEAMAAGVPIVTTDVGCVGSFFRPQVDGRVVRPDDPGALAMAIREQVREPERREAMRRSARERAFSFPSSDELRTANVSGWRAAFLPNREVGPRFELWVGCFLLAAIATRLLSAFLFHDSLVNREWGFYTLVDHWFQGYGYSYARELGCASAYRSPGFLFFLTGMYFIFSPTNTLAQALVQNAFVVVVLWLVYVVGSRLVGKRAALIGGFLMMVYPYTFYHYTQYYHTYLSSLFLLLIVWLLLRIAERKRYRDAFYAGLAIAGLAYIQGTILPATPFLVAWLLWKMWPSWKRVFWMAVIMAVTSAALIAPWTYRNWTQFHEFVPLTTDLGHAFFKANNEIIYELTLRGYPQEIVNEITVSSTNPMYKQYRMPADLEASFIADGVFQESIAWTEWHPREPNGDVATCADLGPLNEAQFSDYWMERGMSWFTAHWWPEGLKLQLLKVKTFWQPSLFPSVKTGAPWPFANDPVKVWLATNVMTLGSAVVLVGGWIGLIVAMRRKRRDAFLIFIFLCIYTALHTFFAGYTKYRMPLDNLIAPFAGWTIVALWDKLRGKPGPRV